MKSTGTALFVVGAILVVIGAIWGFTGYYLSQAPALLALLIAGLGLMWGGSRLNRDKNPNKSVAWKPASDAVAVATDEAVAPPPTVIAPTPQVALDEATRVVSAGIPRAWRLTDADGITHLVGSRALLGRDPGQGDGPASVLIVLSAADGSISKTHASVRVDEAGLWVTDLSSTNGTVVLMPTGAEVECLPGLEVSVPNGSTIEIGTYPVKVSV